MIATVCEQIKSRLTLREAAALVNVTLPERDGKKFPSPLRPDRSPSCTIYGETMRDWSRGETFDAIDFYAAARGMEAAEAIWTLAAHLGIASGQHNGRRANQVKKFNAPKAHDLRPAVTNPAALVSFEATVPTSEDFAAILRTRNLPPEAEPGLLLAHQVKVLHIAKVGGFACWVVSDDSKHIAEARRLDGQPFPAVGSLGERKAHTLRGSTKSWPCGLALQLPPARLQKLQHLPLVLVEGGPDLLGAFAVLASMPIAAQDTQPCAMLGASASIGAEALSSIAGRQCVILAHGDLAGRTAGTRWAGQLSAAGSRVAVRHLPEGKDLADLLTENPPAALAGLLSLKTL